MRSPVQVSAHTSEGSIHYPLIRRSGLICMSSQCILWVHSLNLFNRVSNAKGPSIAPSIGKSQATFGAIFVNIEIAFIGLILVLSSLQIKLPGMHPHCVPPPLFELHVSPLGQEPQSRVPKPSMKVPHSYPTSLQGTSLGRISHSSTTQSQSKG